MTTLEELQVVHYQLKAHPFRLHHDEDMRSDYIHLSYQLASLYSKWAYWETDNSKLAQGSAYWVHNYNCCLSIWRNCGAEKDKWIVYYDQMLGVIHHFLETKELPKAFYNMERDAQGEHHIVKYVLVTEDCPVKSPHIPGYFRYDERLRDKVTVEEVAEVYMQVFRHLNKDRARIYAQDYVDNDLPVLAWVKEQKGSS